MIKFSLPPDIVHKNINKNELNNSRRECLRTIQTKPIFANASTASSPLPGRAYLSTPLAKPQIDMRFAPNHIPTHMPTHVTTQASAPLPQPSVPMSITFAMLTPAQQRQRDQLRLRSGQIATGGIQIQPTTAATEPCKSVDQYSVIETETTRLDKFARFLQLCYAVLWHHEIKYQDYIQWTTQNKNITLKAFQDQLNKSYLGPTGHLERFSARTHLFGAIAFVVYAILRHILLDDSTTSGVMVSLSAWVNAATFASSTIYHATTPDRDVAYVTRLLDYAGIYFSITFSALADISVVTRGFYDIPWQSIIDIPIAATIIYTFFVLRRLYTPAATTWHERRPLACAIGNGLYSAGHCDLEHAGAREATSLMLAIAYFLYIPAAFSTLGTTVAGVVVALQVVSFLVILFGMLLDLIIGWPDTQILKGKAKWAACKDPCCLIPCGCALNSHGWWHIVSLVSAALLAGAREYALANV